VANPPLNNVTATGFVNNDKISSLTGTTDLFDDGEHH